MLRTNILEGGPHGPEYDMSGYVTKADRVARLFCSVIDEIINSRAITAVADGQISEAQFIGLQYVYLHPDCCIKDLAGGLKVSHPAAVKLVERLEAKEFISRTAHARDRRIVQLSATDYGKQLTEQIMITRSHAIEDLLNQASANCSCDIIEVLETFVKVALEDSKDLDGVCLRCGCSHDDDCPVCETEYEITGELRTNS